MTDEALTPYAHDLAAEIEDSIQAGVEAVYSERQQPRVAADKKLEDYLKRLDAGDAEERATGGSQVENLTENWLASGVLASAGLWS